MNDMLAGIYRPKVACQWSIYVLEVHAVYSPLISNNDLIAIAAEELRKIWNSVISKLVLSVRRIVKEADMKFFPIRNV